eukprot:3759220-Prymnesium_polylepis.1
MTRSRQRRHRSTQHAGAAVRAHEQSDRLPSFLRVVRTRRRLRLRRWQRHRSPRRRRRSQHAFRTRTA